MNEEVFCWDRKDKQAWELHKGDNVIIRNPTRWDGHTQLLSEFRVILLMNVIKYAATRHLDLKTLIRTSNFIMKDYWMLIKWF